MSSLQVRKMTYAALYLAIAMVLPFITGQIPEIGSALCPMHIPALLCGFMCGWPWGLAVGFIAPLLRSVLFGMPAMVPGAVLKQIQPWERMRPSSMRAAVPQTFLPSGTMRSFRPPKEMVEGVTVQP